MALDPAAGHHRTRIVSHEALHLIQPAASIPMTDSGPQRPVPLGCVVRQQEGREVRCGACECEFSAQDSQGYPRDNRSPGRLVFRAAVWLVVGAMCGAVGWLAGQSAPLLLCGIPLAVGFAAATDVPRAVSGVARGRCPGCGHEQPVRWYSQ